MTESSKRVFREHAYKLLEFLDDPTADERTLANQCVGVGRLVLAELPAEVPEVEQRKAG